MNRLPTDRELQKFMSNELVRLHRFIVRHFDKGEFEELSFNLQIDVEELRGERKSEKVTDFLLMLGRQHKFDELLSQLKELRDTPFEEAKLSIDKETIEALYAALPQSSVSQLAKLKEPGFSSTKSENLMEDDDEDKGLLDFILEGAQAISNITQILNNHSNAATILASKLNSHTNSLNMASKQGNVSQIARISTIAAIDMNQYSKVVEKDIVPGLKKGIEITEENVSGYILAMADFMKEKKNEEVIKLRIAGLYQSICTLLEQNEAQLKNTLKLRTNASQKGTTRESNRARRRLVKAIDQLIQAFEMVETFCKRNLRLIDEYFDGLTYGESSSC